MNKPTVALPLVTGDEPIRVLPIARNAARVPSGGWLRASRLARGISQRRLAAKLGFKRQAWAQLETSEARDAISLYSLRRAADALDCDLVYYIVPRGTAGGTAPAGEQAKARRGSRKETASTRAPKEEPETRAAWVEPELPMELR
jgi:transcriptional regulator with XRE-family HTH domain